MIKKRYIQENIISIFLTLKKLEATNVEYNEAR